jgi:hypothetical protein
MMRVADFGRWYTQEAADLFAREAQDMRRGSDSRAANRYLLEKLGTELSPDCDEGYYTEALNYHLALLHAHARQPERMAECIAQSKTMPAPRDNSIFSDHVTLSVVTRDHQQDAIERQVPSFLFACMPHGATVHPAIRPLSPASRCSIGTWPAPFFASPQARPIACTATRFVRSSSCKRCWPCLRLHL